MIAGVGTDIIEIERFNRENSPRFLNRCYTAREQAYLSGKRAQTMAGMFAAKEAVVKAMGTGFRGFWPCAVEILHDRLGKPYTVLHGEAARAAKRRRIGRITVSISHCGTTAMAAAIAEVVTVRDKRFFHRFRRNNPIV